MALSAVGDELDLAFVPGGGGQGAEAGRGVGQPPCPSIAFRGTSVPQYLLDLGVHRI